MAFCSSEHCLSLQRRHKASGASPPPLPLLLRPYVTHTREGAMHTDGCIVADFEPRSIKPHRRARARACSIRFFTRSDWLLLHGAVRQSDRVVDKLTRYMSTVPDRGTPSLLYCFLNSLARGYFFNLLPNDIDFN